MKREPVLTRTAAAAAVSVVVYLLAIAGVKVPGDTMETATDVVYGAALVGSWAWAAWTARKRVRPLSHPAESQTGQPPVSGPKSL